MNPRDDERRKFEAWAKTSPECDGWWSKGGDFTYAHDQYINDDEIESAWRSWLARAEQAETPRAAQKFYLHDKGDPSVGMFGRSWTIEITRTPDPEFTEDELDGLRDALCPDGQIHTEADWEAEAKVGWPDGQDDEGSAAYEESIQPRAAAPVKDRPAPTPEKCNCDAYDYAGMKHKKGCPLYKTEVAPEKE